MKYKLFALLAAILLLAGCNNEDDVLEIFTGKTWKLTYIAAENSHEQYNFWSNDKESEQSFSALKQEGTFIVTFEGTNLNNAVGGTFNAKGINATIDGEWNANGGSHEMSTAKLTSASPRETSWHKPLSQDYRMPSDMEATTATSTSITKTRTAPSNE